VRTKPAVTLSMIVGKRREFSRGRFSHDCVTGAAESVMQSRVRARKWRGGRVRIGFGLVKGGNIWGDTNLAFEYLR